MRGRPGCRRCRARATGLSPVGPPGLARRLPSRGAGAWCCAPLLRWRASALLVCVRRSRQIGGGAGASCLPPPPPVVVFCPSWPLRCVWRFVPCGCPVPSPARMPVHVVRAFGGLGPVVLWVHAAWLLCVCALSPLFFYVRTSRGPFARRW